MKTAYLVEGLWLAEAFRTANSALRLSFLEMGSPSHAACFQMLTGGAHGDSHPCQDRRGSGKSDVAPRRRAVACDLAFGVQLGATSRPNIALHLARISQGCLYSECRRQQHMAAHTCFAAREVMQAPSARTSRIYYATPTEWLAPPIDVGVHQHAQVRGQRLLRHGDS